MTVEWNRYEDPFTLIETRTLLLRAVFADADDPSMLPVVVGLLTTYEALVQREVDRGRYTPGSNQSAGTADEALVLFQRVFRDEYGQRVDLPWPVALPFRDDLPRFLIVGLARATAQRASERIHFHPSGDDR